MSSIVIDPMLDGTMWPLYQPDGTTLSTAGTVSPDTSMYVYGSDLTSLLFDIPPGHMNHLYRRLIAPTNLNDFDEVRCWINAERAAAGSAALPFFLEIRLGATGLPIGDPSNMWRSYFPVQASRKWERVSFDIRTLPAAVRSSCSTIELRINDDRAISFHLDSLMAVREEMLIDIDNALNDRFHHKLKAGGKDVNAVINFPEYPPAIDEPVILFTNIGVNRAADRRSTAAVQSNFTDTGSMLQSAIIGFDCIYRIEIFAAQRDHKASILQYLLTSLSTEPSIDILGDRLPLDIIDRPYEDETEQIPSERLPLYIRIKTQLKPAASIPAVRPYQTIAVEVDLP